MRCYVVVAHAHNAASLSDLPCYDFIRETRVDMTLPNERHATAKTVLPKAANFPKWPMAYSFLLADRSHVKVNVHVCIFCLSRSGANELEIAVSNGQFWTQ